MTESIDRRAFFKVAATAGVGIAATGALAACTTAASSSASGTGTSAPAGPEPLPPATPTPNDPFGTDMNINIGTIDDFLGRDDVLYRDVRMFNDPARFEDVGGLPFTSTIEGFKVTPMPFMMTMSTLPVPGAYAGPTAYTVEWGENRGEILSAHPNYEESELLLNDVFPKDTNIFLLCGGAGYSANMKALLVYLGWDQDRLYVLGAHWAYQGDHNLEFVIPADDSGKTYPAFWRVDYAYIDFDLLHPLS